MYNLFNDLRDLPLETTDGETGTVRDIYFDDRGWRVHSAVVETGGFLFGHEVLVGAEALGKPDLEKRRWPAAIAKEDLEDAPDPETVETVGDQERRRRAEMRSRWPMYMLSPSGAAYTPLLAEEQIKEMRKAEEKIEQPPAPVTSRIRSMAGVCGYDVEAIDGEVGTVADFLVNPLDWTVRHIMVDTGEWLPGKLVVLSVDWIEAIDWDERRVLLSTTKHHVEHSPGPSEIAGLTRSENDLLIAHYGGPI